MTEADWQLCTDPGAMVKNLIGKTLDRKLRLFSCACARREWDSLSQECFQNAVQVAERFADGLASKKELAAAKKISGAAFSAAEYRAAASAAEYHAATLAWSTTRDVGSAAMYPTWVAANDNERSAMVSLLHDVFGNPFQEIVISETWLTWNDATVPKLSQRIYNDRAFNLMPILADALEAAGCRDAAILDHCRQPGEHVRGCWVLDLLLGKE